MSKKDDGRKLAETSVKILAPTIAAGVGAAAVTVGATIASLPLLPLAAGVGVAVGLWAMLTSDSDK